MSPEEHEKKKEEAQMHQAVMMARFKTSEEFAFICNILKIKKYTYFKERQKAFKTQNMRETCLYFNGKEDAVDELFEAIDKTIADGEALRDRNALIAAVTQAEEAENAK